jgi:hypothetical protein
VFLGIQSGHTEKEKEMTHEKDMEVPGVGVQSKEHKVRTGIGPRVRYPFTAMVRNDYFVLMCLSDALKARNALKSFYRRYPARRFTVRQRQEDQSVWICRRVE